MSDQRPDISRFSVTEGGITVDRDGDLMYHSDHLRHLTLAKIAVLEEVVEELNGFSWAQLKIAVLRKELEQ